MSQFPNIAVANTLTADDAKAIYESGFARVVDLRCAPCLSSRPVEEPIVRRLENYRIAYTQLALDGEPTRSDRLSDFKVFVSDTDENILVVTDIPSEIARDIYLQSDSDLESLKHEPMLAVA